MGSSEIHEEIQNSTFEDSDIVIDGKKITGCVFRDCTIIYNGGPTLFRSNDLRDTDFEFGGAAARTLKFLRGIYESGGQAAVEDVIEFLETGAN